MVTINHLHGLCFILKTIFMYSITFETKSGGSGVVTNKDFDKIKQETIKLFKKKLPATVYRSGIVIGRVFEDDSCRLGWNWTIENI